MADSFPSEVVDFRNTLVHDISSIKTNDSNRLAFFVAKLKAIYAVSDALALGGKVDEIRDGSKFLMAAKHTTRNSFSGGDEADIPQSD